MPELDARREAVTFETALSALLVMDMHNAFVKAGGMLSLHAGDISAVTGVFSVEQHLPAAARGRPAGHLPGAD